MQRKPVSTRPIFARFPMADGRKALEILFASFFTVLRFINTTVRVQGRIEYEGERGRLCGEGVERGTKMRRRRKERKERAYHIFVLRPTNP